MLKRTASGRKMNWVENCDTTRVSIWHAALRTTCAIYSPVIFSHVPTLWHACNGGRCNCGESRGADDGRSERVHFVDFRQLKSDHICRKSIVWGRVCAPDAALFLESPHPRRFWRGPWYRPPFRPFPCKKMRASSDAFVEMTPKCNKLRLGQVDRPPATEVKSTPLYSDDCVSTQFKSCSSDNSFLIFCTRDSLGV